MENMSIGKMDICTDDENFPVLSEELCCLLTEMDFYPVLAEENWKYEYK